MRLDLKEVWQAFLQPEIADERRAAQNMWDSLPEDLQTDDQVLGRHSAGCAATYGVMEACDFACTACYLADTAEDTPPLPFEDIQVQLQQIREHLGPWGNTQITAGEVTLLPREELARIIKYCIEIELAPMLMTNGQNILKDPSYLEYLVQEAGLDKVAIHIDITEKGRLGLKNKDREADIHWIRDAFANLIRQTRKRTGKELSASHTFTVTEKNFDDIPDVMRWMAKNNDAFRMISFQPTANVGRTREKEQVGQADSIWDKISEGLNHPINSRAYKFGHPDCNQVALTFVFKWQDKAGAEHQHVMDVVRDGEGGDTDFFQSLIHKGFAGFSPDGEQGAVVLARILGRFRKHPTMLARVPAFCVSRGLSDREMLTQVMRAAIAGRPWSLSPLVVVVHNFMSARELETETGKARLAACSFRVPVDNRMVPMCELNGTELRKSLNQSDQERLVTIKRAAS